MANPEKYISILAKMASSVEPVRKARLAAGIIIRNEIISFGINQLKSHPLQSKFGKNSDSIYLHAEIDAIKNALKLIDVNDLKKSSLYITRVKYDSWEKKNLIYGLARPCLGCQRAIMTFQISKVIFTNDDQKIVSLNF